MIVSMWMTRDLFTASPDMPIVEAVLLMRERNIRRLPVVDQIGKHKRLLGLATANDVLHAFPEGVNPYALDDMAREAIQTSLADVMVEGVLTTSAEAPIEDVARMMFSHKIGAVPVLRDGWLVGIITESDIFRAFVSMMGMYQTGARITFDVTEAENILTFMGDLAARYQLDVTSLFTYHQNGRRFCVAMVVGKNGEQLDEPIEEIWSSGHCVLSVLNLRHTVDGQVEGAPRGAP